MTSSSSDGAGPAGNLNSGYHYYHIDRDAGRVGYENTSWTEWRFTKRGGSYCVSFESTDETANTATYRVVTISLTANTATYRVVTIALIDSVDNLFCTLQGESTALLALVATARHIYSLVAFSAAGSGGCGNDMHSQPSNNQSNNASNNNTKTIIHQRPRTATPPHHGSRAASPRRVSSTTTLAMLLCSQLPGITRRRRSKRSAVSSSVPWLPALHRSLVRPPRNCTLLELQPRLSTRRERMHPKSAWSTMV